MCACRIEEMQSSRATYDLEDYIFEMETRGNFDNSPDAEDVYAQLAQKDKDLVLAAELGKALLEKNEELSRTNERLLDEFTSKLEHLEQEKHALKRKLDSVEGEYEGKVLELQSDIHLLRKELEQNQQMLGQTEREKAQIISELTEQNQRLTTQLKQASHAEEQLSSQLKYLREQFNLRKTNMHDHVSQLEMLREEINIITEKKAELERRIETLIEERDQLMQTLEDSTDRIIMLEKHSREQELQMRNNERDLEELRQTNVHLQERVEVLSRRSSTPPSLCHTSLLNEIEMSEDEMRSFNSSQHNGRSKSQSHPSLPHGYPIEIEDDEDIECDDTEVPVPFASPENEDLIKLRQEVLDVYQQLRLMCEQLRRRRNSISSASTSSEELMASQVKVGMLMQVMKELRGLLHDIMRKEAKGVCLTCGNGPAERQELEKHLATTKESLEKLQRTVGEKNDELKKKSEEIVDLTSKLNIQQAELVAIQEERNLLKRDLEDSHLSRDEIVKKAWEVRDQAVSRKNNLEVELARTRIEVMNTNSQLIEAIQQKLELSQQLEQWQVDMESLLDEQIKKKLNQQERDDITEDSDTSSNMSTKSKFFGLFR